jgi:hypothetical protein
MDYHEIECSLRGYQQPSEHSTETLTGETTLVAGGDFEQTTSGL